MDNGAENYRRFLNGDNSGLVEIVREYKDGLIFYLRGFTDDILQAEELAEDTQHFALEVQRFLGKLAALADYPIAYEQSENLAEISDAE